jgi:DNA-binding MurR/RpiR family transcriptional regulator
MNPIGARAPQPPGDLHEVRMLVASRALQIPGKAGHVLRVALDYPADVAFGTARSLALRCSVSPTTVMRLLRILGFRNFREFRELCRREIARERDREG